MNEIKLYVLRMRDGNCAVVAAADEGQARKAILERDEIIAGAAEEAGGIVSVRELDPSDFVFYGCLQWDEGMQTVDFGPIWGAALKEDIFEHEYPLVLQALKKVNGMPFAPGLGRDEPVVSGRGASAMKRGRKREKEILHGAMEAERIKHEQLDEPGQSETES
jgi:hypothetical protein